MFALFLRVAWTMGPPRDEPLTVRRPPRRPRWTKDVASTPLCDRCHRCPATHDVTIHLVGYRCDAYSMCVTCAQWAVEDDDDDGNRGEGLDGAEERIVYGSEHVYA